MYMINVITKSSLRVVLLSKSINRLIAKSAKKYKILFIAIIVIVKALWLQETKTKLSYSRKNKVFGENEIKHIMTRHSFIKHTFIENLLCSRNCTGSLTQHRSGQETQIQFIHSFIHSLGTNLLTVYFASGTAVNQTDEVCLRRLTPHSSKEWNNLKK